MPELSLVVGFRNRDKQRVHRFLDSLSKQTFQDFELLFIDYGSRTEIAAEIQTLCDAFAFCRYVYCHSNGRFWNRAHALNIGIRMAQGKYYLSADVDLIYDRNSLLLLSKSVSRNNHVFCRAYLLPRNYKRFDQLSKKPMHFPLSHEQTIGIFHCVPMEFLYKLNGYDEFFQIWGFEDGDLANRLDEAGLVRETLDHTEAPVYHQWHQPGSEHPFMRWWWKEMSIYYSGVKLSTVSLNQDWGHLLTREDRLVSQLAVTQKYVVPQGMSQFDLTYFIEKLVTADTSNSKSISVTLYREPDIMFHNLTFGKRILKGILLGCNWIFNMIRVPIYLKISDKVAHRSEVDTLYAFYTIIFHSYAIHDYAFEEYPDRFEIVLCFRQRSGQLYN